ncbi:MAG: aminotransferase class I/II-fold pyridoxal phosphate-dependent enzyme [Acidimicrobiia bacterium]
MTDAFPARRGKQADGSAGGMRRSGIRDVFDAVWALPEAIHLEVGEPNFPTPPHIIDAAAQAARDGMTKYTPNAGIPQLREALAAKVSRVNRFDPKPDQIVVTTGGIGGLCSALLAVAKPGDQVMIGDPGWPNYRMICELQGLDMVYYPISAGTGFQPVASELASLISDRTRVLVINSPSNPTGSVFDTQVLGDLYELAQAHDLWVISDEVYDEVTFEGTPLSIASMDSDGRVITVYSFSKTHSMTGWRVGYVIAPEPVAELVARVQEAMTSCVNAPAQAAALAATTGPQDHVEMMRSAYRERRDRVLEILGSFEVPAMTPEGAFYVWIDISGAGTDDISFAKRLIDESLVAVVPGTTFGPNGGRYIRISLATAPDELYEGVTRIGNVYRSLLI